MRSALLKLSLLSVLSLSAAACAAPVDSGESAESDLSKTGIAVKDVKIQKATIALHGSMVDYDFGDEKAGEIVGYEVKARPGELLQFSVNSYGFDGSFYLLEDTGAAAS